MSIDTSFLAVTFNLTCKGPEVEIQNLGTVETRQPNTLTYIEDIRYLEQALLSPYVTGIITTSDIIRQIDDKTCLAANHPRLTFYNIHNYLAQHTNFYHEVQPVHISPSAQIHPSAWIDQEGVYIGENVYIGPRVVVLAGTHIEPGVCIQSGAVIGSEGFEYKRNGEKIIPVVHAGGVWLDEEVEVGANTCIDKAVFGDYTRIGRYSKLDNLIHIAHAVNIGARCFLVALVMVGGSVLIEDDVYIGPGALISNGLRIGQGARISLGAVVTRDVPAGTTVSGNFAIEHTRFLNFIRSIR